MGGCVDDDDLIAVPLGGRQRAVQPRWMLALHVHIDCGILEPVAPLCG
jgi:hypothetical protein